MFQFIRDRSHDLAQLTGDFEPPAPFPYADEHLCASAFQKAIRRSNMEIARRAAHQLYHLDRPRLWRRLMVIALEDVGIGAVNVATELVGIAAISSARKLLGGDLIALDIAVARACQAVKDRSGDHLGSIVSREPIDRADEAALRTASPNALLAMLASSHLPWPRRLRAALLVAGRSGTESVPSNSGIRAVFDVLHELGAPVHLIAACETYAARQRDALPIMVPFAWIMHATDGSMPCVVAHGLPPYELIGEIPDWSLDPLWTRIGKSAVDLFIRSRGMKPQFSARQVAAALWNSESALCDRTLAWYMTDELRNRAHTADLFARGLPRELHTELNAWIARERPALTAARRVAFESAVKASGQAQKASEQANLPLPVPRRTPRND